METVISKPYAEVTYSDLIISVVWKSGDFTTSEFNELYTQTLKYGETVDPIGFYTDLRNQRVMSPNERSWFQDNAVPRAVELGMKYVAVVFTGNIFKRYYLNNIMNTVSKFGVPMKFFSKPEEAKAWLHDMMNNG